MTDHDRETGYSRRRLRLRPDFLILVGSSLIGYVVVLVQLVVFNLRWNEGHLDSRQSESTFASSTQSGYDTNVIHLP